jgi:hypothetical protein
MFEIGPTLVSHDVITCHFACDLSKCKGACCVQGDSGAPLEDAEAATLQKIYPVLKPLLRTESVLTIEETGSSVTDSDGDLVTPLNKGIECVYALFEEGVACCAIEKAFLHGLISFRKPISCFLYPIRTKKYKLFEAVNYDQWEICKPAIERGLVLNKKVYQFVQEALLQKYGREWVGMLERAAQWQADNTDAMPLK